MKDYKEILIEESTKKWLYNTQPCYMSYDFTGYLLKISTKYQIFCALSWDGQFIMYTTSEKHPEISKRKFNKFLKTLIKNKILRIGIQPFNELKQIPINYDHLVMVHDYFFSEVRKV